ncbi:thioredoxin domain-containing protein [Rhodospirillum rubrum]|uniref:Spermatogenesis-associated protein 20-like TRX domain-containing protein n=1 Tax=Rhodospirillum rubrum (strain ATCC 11170 / ATH 1.1.1 / DSM 467 / LMG 4362 / NCIMB 8255 / S1) TaxID=269796 RepID=Q2RN79_RHORT|nr:thioredoxin domain-containing protein [Rhodospirillum rubrum]ABC24416.1 Protein of unknown function DUF255 [Rhodospirillum rubrum ATCC 11170]AEO50167.1 hypothetical protein F11_18535 [Rhodospirillum rubrum F11]MBK5956136.1 thioredoxin domain-containing protein [Rhodospirillum rubrum]QXG80339.1 thioredoxin domain-containing protein [Rhodospirillum rubrum]
MSRNRLGEETSPYLLQHKDNPVHWLPWGEEAFAEARALNRPVLLSIGYSACHWCHVMAHESFEHPQVAEVMNALFVSVKVDREEHPDVDALYQGALALMGEQGGWPLTLFLTPEGEPVTGGTYFPREPRYGRPGFVQVLRQVSEIFRSAPDKVAETAARLREALAEMNAGDRAGGVALSLPQLDDAARALLSHIDGVAGGLSGAPKFPMPFVFDFLWRAYLRTGDAKLRAAVTLTLERMAQGGIYDHLAGGFARYSTDSLWLAPHFEKMLYDNAQLIALMTLVWKTTRSPLLARRIAQTVAWAQSEMIGDNGAFAASLDADSEGGEGRFYVWDEAEIDAALGEQAALFKQAYDVTPQGNWEGRTILNRATLSQPPTHASGLLDEGKEDAIDAALAPARALLLDRRGQRPRPGRDDKVLADWNGLMIAALAEAGEALSRPEWVALGRSAFDAVVATMSREDGRLGHAWCAGRLGETALLEDYAGMIHAALALHGISGEAAFLTQAQVWAETVERQYRDPRGGYFQSAADASALIVRTRGLIDSAQPSGNGLLAQGLARLFLLTGKELYRQRAEDILASYGASLSERFPHTVSVLAAFELLAAGIQVVLVNDDGRLGRVLAEAPSATLVVTRLSEGTPLPRDHPAFGKTALGGRPTAYVCRGPVCGRPLTQPDDLRQDLLGR